MLHPMSGFNLFPLFLRQRPQRLRFASSFLSYCFFLFYFHFLFFNLFSCSFFLFYLSASRLARRRECARPVYPPSCGGNNATGRRNKTTKGSKKGREEIERNETTAQRHISYIPGLHGGTPLSVLRVVLSFFFSSNRPATPLPRRAVSLAASVSRSRASRLEIAKALAEPVNALQTSRGSVPSIRNILSARKPERTRSPRRRVLGVNL